MNKNKLSTYLQWDVENWGKALPFWERHLDDPGKKLKCLELGSKKGGLSLWLAEKGHDVVCSDLVDHREVAKPFHDQFKFEGNISYEVIDATNIPYQNAFDVVVFKSMLGGASRLQNDPVKQVVIDQVFDALKPGGRLLFAENLESTFLHKLARRRFAKWSIAWNYLSYSEVEPLFNSYGSFHSITKGFIGMFGPNQTIKRNLAKCDTYLFDYLVPKRYRYIFIGVAVK